MTSPQIKILLSLGCATSIYAFVCDIRFSRKAKKLGNWIQEKRPDLWPELTFFARSLRGGLPDLKILYRNNALDLPRFDKQYEELRLMEKRFLWSLGLGVVCIGSVILGYKFFGWRW